MNLIIIDDSDEFLALVRAHLARELPDAELTLYNPERDGRPPTDFDWTRFQVLLLDYQLGREGTGLEWLQDLRSKPGFPPTVLMTATGDEYVAVKAIKLGVCDYIRKQDITASTLAEVVSSAAAAAPAGAPSGAPETGMPRDRGASIGYNFVRLIGQGAMSNVFLAQRLRDGIELVLKVINVEESENPEILTRFIQEAELIAGIDSPHVVKIYEQGFSDDFGFISMEYFARGDLKRRIEGGLTPDDALRYLIAIAKGLDAVHRLGVVHRDLKPANIMFRDDDTLALADFGISKRLGASSDLTSLGKILGTPHYMSPEQGQGVNVGFGSDFYSTGVIFYEMLMGEKPYRAESPAALIYQHVHLGIPRLPPALHKYQAVVDRLLAKDVNDRVQSVAELMQLIGETV